MSRICYHRDHRHQHQPIVFHRLGMRQIGLQPWIGCFRIRHHQSRGIVLDCYRMHLQSQRIHLHLYQHILIGHVLNFQQQTGKHPRSFHCCYRHTHQCQCRRSGLHPADTHPRCLHIRRHRCLSIQLESFGNGSVMLALPSPSSSGHPFSLV